MTDLSVLSSQICKLTAALRENTEALHRLRGEPQPAHRFVQRIEDLAGEGVTYDPIRGFFRPSDPRPSDCRAASDPMEGSNAA